MNFLEIWFRSLFPDDQKVISRDKKIMIQWPGQIQPGENAVGKETLNCEEDENVIVDRQTDNGWKDDRWKVTIKAQLSNKSAELKMVSKRSKFKHEEGVKETEHLLGFVVWYGHN